MRVTITLSEGDSALFKSVAKRPVFEFVEPSVVARHLFLRGLKEALKAGPKKRRAS